MTQMLLKEDVNDSVPLSDKTKAVNETNIEKRLPSYVTLKLTTFSNKSANT